MAAAVVVPALSLAWYLGARGGADKLTKQRLVLEPPAERSEEPSKPRSSLVPIPAEPAAQAPVPEAGRRARGAETARAGAKGPFAAPDALQQPPSEVADTGEATALPGGRTSALKPADFGEAEVVPGASMGSAASFGAPSAPPGESSAAGLAAVRTEPGGAASAGMAPSAPTRRAAARDAKPGRATSALAGLGAGTRGEPWSGEPGGGGAQAAVSEPAAGGLVLGGAGAGSSAQASAGSGAAGLANPSRGSGGGGRAGAPGESEGPGGGESVGPPEGTLTRTDAERLQRMIDEQRGLVRELTASLAGGLDATMKRYAPQVGRAAESAAKVPESPAALGVFAPSGSYPDAKVHGDLETFLWFIVSGKDKDAPAAAKGANGAYVVRAGGLIGVETAKDGTKTLLLEREGAVVEQEPDFGLKARLVETRALIAGMDGCLARVGVEADAGPEGSACIAKAEKALRRRAQPAIGFIPVAKAARLELSGEEGGGKKGLKGRYDELKARGSKDARAKDAARHLLEALKAGNEGVRGVLQAFEKPPFEPGAAEDASKALAKARAAALREVAKELASFRLPPGQAGLELERLLRSAAESLEEAALGLGRGLKGPLDAAGKPGKINAVDQFAIAVQAAARALGELKRAAELARELVREAPEGPGRGDGEKGGPGPGGGEGGGGGNAGLSLMALLHKRFDCNATLNAFGKGPIRFGYLETTFGDNRACLDRLLKHPRFEAVRVHLWNGSCVRLNRCFETEVLKGLSQGVLDQKLASGDEKLLAALERDAERVRGKLAAALKPGAACYVSGILEHDLSAKSAKRVVALLRPVFEGLCQVVNNPSGNNSRVRGVGADVEEWHGDDPKPKPPCIVDPDGSEVADYAGYAARYASCRLVLFWNQWMNCLGPGEEKSPPAPMNRTNCPTPKTLAAMAKALREGALEPAPGCGSRDSFVDGDKKDNLWKPEADHQADKSVVMFRKSYLLKAKTVEVLDAETEKRLGSVTCDFPKFQPGGVCGVYSEDGSDRPFFRVKKARPGRPVRVRLILRDGSTVCFEDVKDPAKRYD